MSTMLDALFKGQWLASRNADAVRADAAEFAGKAIPCPECDLRAEVTDRFVLEGTDGPVDHVAVACPAGHYFRMAVDRLSAQAQEQLGACAVRPVAQLCPEEGGAGAPARR